MLDHCTPPPGLLRQRRTAKIYRPSRRYYLTFGTLQNIAEGIRRALTQNEIFRSRKQLFRDYSAETLYVEKVEPLLAEKL
jgi:hypothetical protein